MNYKYFIHLYLMFFIFIIPSCKKENDLKIIGQYYIQKIGDSKASLSYEINQNEPKINYKKTLISSYIYEVQWNDNFLLAKQYPEYEIQVEALSQIFHINRRKIMKEKELTDENEFYLDSLLVENVRNNSKIEFEQRLENGDLKFLNKIINHKHTTEQNITFYYLFDIKNNPYEPFVFFDNDSLNYYINNMKVGDLKHQLSF